MREQLSERADKVIEQNGEHNTSSGKNWQEDNRPVSKARNVVVRESGDKHREHGDLPDEMECNFLQDAGLGVRTVDNFRGHPTVRQLVRGTRDRANPVINLHTNKNSPKIQYNSQIKLSILKKC